MDNTKDTMTGEATGTPVPPTPPAPAQQPVGATPAPSQPTGQYKNGLALSALIFSLVIGVIMGGALLSI